MAIPFTQFMMPDGRRVPVTIDRPADIESKARDLIDQGYVFEIEMLMTGKISMEIIKHGKEDEVLAGELCDNGPAVPAAVDRMVCDAMDKWLLI